MIRQAPDYSLLTKSVELKANSKRYCGGIGTIVGFSERRRVYYLIERAEDVGLGRKFILCCRGEFELCPDQQI